MLCSFFRDSMQWALRQLDAEETDYELVFGVLFVPLLTIVTAVLAHVPSSWIPSCWIHGAIGIPCPTCGAYRSLRLLMAGNATQAWLTHPLLSTMAVTAILHAIYSFVVVLGRLPRLRLSNVSGGERWAAMVVAAGLVMANWVYLFARGI